jgi:hypothetical protein
LLYGRYDELALTKDSILRRLTRSAEVIRFLLSSRQIIQYVYVSLDNLKRFLNCSKQALARNDEIEVVQKGLRIYPAA